MAEPTAERESVCAFCDSFPVPDSGAIVVVRTLYDGRKVCICSRCILVCMSLIVRNASEATMMAIIKQLLADYTPPAKEEGK